MSSWPCCRLWTRRPLTTSPTAPHWGTRALPALASPRSPIMHALSPGAFHLAPRPITLLNSKASRLRVTTPSIPCHSKATPVVFFCDNRYALNMTEGKWKPNSNRHLISTTADKFKLLRLSTAVSLFWVPGHAGIHQNKLVDRLAKAGASGLSFQWDGPAPAHIPSQGITPPLHPTCPAAPTTPSSTSPPASILTEAALSPPRPIRRSSRLQNSKPPQSLFPEVNWFGASPRPPQLETTAWTLASCPSSVYMEMSSLAPPYFPSAVS